MSATNINSQSENILENSNFDILQIEPFIHCIKVFFDAFISCLTSLMSLIRISICLMSLTVFMWYRLLLNGDSKLYNWTILENHISLLPNIKERVLSYAQMHFWYFFKLVYPRYLCFDYGYACIPVVTRLSDWRNLFSLTHYFIISYFIYRCIRDKRSSLLFSIALMLIPISPALNIGFPYIL